MIKLLKKYKYLLPVLLSAAGILIYFWVFKNSITSVYAPADITVYAKNVQEFPQNPAEKLSDIKYALQKIYNGSSNLLFRSGNNIRSRNSAPPECKLRTAAMSASIKIYNFNEKLFTLNEHHFVFQRYLRYSLPLRAGPHTV